MPHTPPCISRKYRSHDLNKPAFGKGKLIILFLIHYQTMQEWE